MEDFEGRVQFSVQLDPSQIHPGVIQYRVYIVNVLCRSLGRFGRFYHSKLHSDEFLGGLIVCLHAQCASAELPELVTATDNVNRMRRQCIVTSH